MKCSTTVQDKSFRGNKNKSDCGSLDSVDFQKFPHNGLLKKNSNKDLKELKKVLIDEKPQLIYAYVLTSVENEKNSFLQTGSAPNFQGDHITLCSCMHHMRCFIKSEDWEKDVWVAGISGSNYSNKNNYLFYLMKISNAYTSQYDLWYSNELTDNDREKKSSQKSQLGDLYVPNNKNIKDKINQLEYKNPPIGHCHHQSKIDDTWESDINYYHGGYKKHQSFLLGDPKHSYIWEKPKIKILYKNYDKELTHHPRTKKYEDYNSFLEILG